MNRFPAWKYALIGLTIALALLFTLPNFFGESPAVQVSSVKATVRVDTALLGRVEETLKKASIPYTQTLIDPNSWEGEWTSTHYWKRQDETDITEVECLPDLNSRLPAT